MWYGVCIGISAPMRRDNNLTERIMNQDHEIQVSGNGQAEALTSESAYFLHEWVRDVARRRLLADQRGTNLSILRSVIETVTGKDLPKIDKFTAAQLAAYEDTLEAANDRTIW